MIDRNARDEAIAAFEEYLDDEISAFEFDGRLQSIETCDRTVNEVVNAAWFHYDDCKDHPVILTKDGWDHFQRLLLLLSSNVELVVSRTRRWSWDHALAWVTVIFFIAAAIGVGWRLDLFLLAVPFGFVSILIDQYRTKNETNVTVHDIACTPFESFSQIRWLRERVPEFRKQVYRSEVGDRTIRGSSEANWNRTAAISLWLLLSPLVLLAQAFPTSDSECVTLTEP